MHESKPFSIGAWGPEEKKDDNPNDETLTDAGFVSTDGSIYARADMTYSLSTGQVFYNGKLILDELRSIAQLTALFTTITGQQ